MSRYKNILPNYAIVTGDANMEPMLIYGENNMCTVEMSGLNSSDASVELHQSLDNSTWGLVPDSPKVLSIGQTSHTWNVRGLVSGAYLRVAVKKGTATAGTITAVKLLSNV
jgi:hypothetical protein